MVVDGAGPWTRYLRLDPAARAARARDRGDLHVPRELGRVRLGADAHQRPGDQRTLPIAHRALPGPALDELGARLRRLDDRRRPGDRRLPGVPAPVRAAASRPAQSRVSQPPPRRAISVPRRTDDAILPSDLELRRSSVAIILDGQAASGAFVACPSFATYEFGWLRDGSFCAPRSTRSGSSTPLPRSTPGSPATIDAHPRKAEAGDRPLRAGGEVPHERDAARALHPGRRRASEEDEGPGRTSSWMATACGCGRSSSTSTASSRTISRRPSPRRTLPRCDLEAAVLRAAGRSSTTASTHRPWRRSPPGSTPRGGCSTTSGSPPRPAPCAGRLFDALDPRRAAPQGPRGRSRRREPALGVVPFGVLRGRRSARAGHRRRRSQLTSSARAAASPLSRRHLLRRRRVDCSDRVARLARVLAGDRDGYRDCKRWLVAAGAPTWQRAAGAAHGGTQDPGMVEPWVERWGPVATPLPLVARDVLLMLRAAEDAGWSCCP